MTQVTNIIKKITDRSTITSLCAAALFSTSCFSGAAFGAGTDLCASASITKTNIVDINSIRGVLYKTSNLHGGRGPSFLVGPDKYRSHKRSTPILDIKCNKVSSFGLFAEDHPYGERRYENSPGGSHHTSSQLVSFAKKAGSKYLLAGVAGGKWIKFDPSTRGGSTSRIY